jgi:hypothetical protein
MPIKQLVQSTQLVGVVLDGQVKFFLNFYYRKRGMNCLRASGCCPKIEVVHSKWETFDHFNAAELRIGKYVTSLVVRLQSLMLDNFADMVYGTECVHSSWLNELCVHVHSAKDFSENFLNILCLGII